MFLKRRRWQFGNRWIDYGAFVLCAFDENRNQRCGNIPAIVLNRFIEEMPILFRRRQYLHVLKSTYIHPQSAWVFKKKLGMRAAGNQSAGRFLIEIFGQASPDLRDRTAHISPAYHDRKIPYVGCVLLLEMEMEKRLWHSARSKRRPGPVVFPLHHG